MSKLGQYATAILQGGLPAALDLGAKAGLATGDSKPEQTAPSPKVTDRDTSTVVKANDSIIDFMGAKEWTIAAIGGVVVITVLFFAIRGAARIK